LKHYRNHIAVAYSKHTDIGETTMVYTPTNSVSTREDSNTAVLRLM